MTPEEALKIIQEKGYHKYYKQSVQLYVDMAIHAEGLPPGELLKKRRPKESKEIQDYREAIYIEKTEAPVLKVINSLMKIRKSQDWMIRYPKEVPSVINEDETLENYMEEYFPYHTSFTNWYFSLAFVNSLVDANSVALIMPTNLVEEGGSYVVESDNEYLKPYPTIFLSEQVLNYSRDYFLLHSTEKNKYVKDRMMYEGNIYYLVDKENIHEIREIDPKPRYEVITYNHNLGVIPVVKTKAWIKKEDKELTLYKSRISPMIPELNEALREYSDLQAEVVQHIHSTMWAFESQKCSACSGTGMIPKKDASPVQCKTCKGKGSLAFNPYENYIIRNPKPGEPQQPTPPIGFIQKQIDIAKLQDQRVQDHIYYAYSALNFEFLAKSPTNQSGYAKDVDKAELNNFVHSVAEDVVSYFDDCYYIINEYRYKTIIPSQHEREKMLPYITVPQKYDILGEQYLLEEIAKLKTSNIDTSILNATLIDYANKKFTNDTHIRNFIVAAISLDPFASENEDSLLMKLQSGGISKKKYIVHCNIKDFLRRAINEYEDFYSTPYEEQTAIMDGYADEMMNETSARAKVITMINAGDSQQTTEVN